MGLWVIFFGANMTGSKHASNKTKNVLVLDRGVVQKINSTKSYAEKVYSPDFTVANKKFCLSLNYNGDDSYLILKPRILKLNNIHCA